MTILINTTPVVEFDSFQSGKLFLHLLQSKVDLHVLASLTFHDMKNSSLPPFSEEGTWHNWLFGNFVNMKEDELGVDLSKVVPKLHFLYCGFIFLWYLVVRFVFAALLLSRNTTPNQMKMLMLLLQRENAIPISTFDKYPVWPFASAVSAEVSLAEK